MTKSEIAAQWVAGFTWEQIPPEVVESVKLQIFDVVGVMLAARTDPLVVKSLQAILPHDANTDAPVVGQTQPVSLANAAMLHGVMAAVLEFDDTHTQSSMHPTSATAAAALPAAQQLGASGRDLIMSVLVGNELSCRLGLVSSKRLFDIATQPTGVFGVFGAGYALSKLRKLPVDQIVSAIGICGSMSSSRMCSWEDGTSAKSLHVGWVASHAVRAVALAEQGISGPVGVFDGRFNLYRALVQEAGTKFDFDMIDRDLGKHWETVNIASKAYPSGFPIHPYLDAVFHLQKQYSLAPDDIAEVRCHIAEVRLATLCEPHPVSPWHARISLQHCVAEALVTGRADKTSYAPEHLHDRDIRQLAERVQCIGDPKEAIDPKRSRAHVAMTLRDGRVISHTVEDMRGTRRNPMTRSDFTSKFRSNTHDILPADILDRTIEDFLDLDNISDVRSIFERITANAR